AIGYVDPALAKEWGLTKGALGPVFSAGLFGLMIGALRFGPLADRIGRKKIIIPSTLAFGIGALVTAFVNDLNTLLAIRFLTGLGLGGAMPNAVAMTSEFSPHRRRATMVMIMFCGFSVGAALGGLLAAALIPQFGWRSVFVVGGAAPLLLVPILAPRLPESVRCLAPTARALVYFIAVFAVAAIGQLGHSVVFVTMAIFAAGFCIVGGQIASNALAATFYPTAVRATGVGWALGIGRIGSIVGPLVGGALLTAKWSTGSVFMAAASAALCAAFAAFLLSR